MSNEALATMNDDELGLASRHTDDVFNDLTIQGGWLPRVQLYTSKSKIVEKELFSANHWGIVVSKDKITDLGPTFNAVPLAYRAMALDFSGKKAVSHYDPSTPEFKECVEKSAVQNSGKMAGIQFLLYVQDHGYVTLFCANKSSKMLAPGIRKLIREYVTFSSHTVDTGKWTFRAPLVNASSVQFDMPPVEEMKAKIKSFVNQAATQETDKDLETFGEGEAQVTVDETGRQR